MFAITDNISSDTKEDSLTTPVQNEETVFGSWDKFFNKNSCIFCKGNLESFLIVIKAGRLLENGNAQTEVG